MGLYVIIKNAPPDSQNYYFNTNVGVSSLPLKSINFSLDQKKTGLFNAKHTTLLFAYNIKIIKKTLGKKPCVWIDKVRKIQVCWVQTLFCANALVQGKSSAHLSGGGDACRSVGSDSWFETTYSLPIYKCR